MSARIYRQIKSAMQSGRRRAAQDWVLDFTPDIPQRTEPLMGWTAGADTRAQLRLTFTSADDAAAYAIKRGWAFEIMADVPDETQAASYSDNFKTGRLTPWTH